VQVREHTESTLRQYDLAGQAARLGWAAADIEVIDADLGLSGRSASHREGFKQLVARVCLIRESIINDWLTLYMAPQEAMAAAIEWPGDRDVSSPALTPDRSDLGRSADWRGTDRPAARKASSPSRIVWPD
jgi:hypothetical protein